jgi:predicted metal-dependent hydrolase
MAIKQFELPTIGKVSLYKRKGSRSLRLSIGHDGAVRVTLPPWLPYKTGLTFVQSKANWIIDQQRNLKPSLKDSQSIGKTYRLQFVQDDSRQRLKTQLKNNLALVHITKNMNINDSQVQQAAQTLSIKALRDEAEELLPTRLQALAQKHGFVFNSVRIRRLKGRWGSCDQHGNITFNLFLMQLPWELIDYVLLHELTHTKVMRHGKPFWDELTRHSPDARNLRKAILTHRPAF